MCALWLVPHCQIRTTNNSSSRSGRGVIRRRTAGLAAAVGSMWSLAAAIAASSAFHPHHPAQQRQHCHCLFRRRRCLSLDHFSSQRHHQYHHHHHRQIMMERRHDRIIRIFPNRLYSSSTEDSTTPPPPPIKNNGTINNNNNTMDVITNPKSTTIKKIQALLTSRKKRVQYGQVVVEGPRMIRDLLCLEKAPSLPPSYSKQQHQQSIPGCNNGSRSIIQQIIVDVDKYDLYKPMLLSSPSVVATTTTVEDAATAAAASSSVPPVILASPDVLAACTDTVQTQGIVAICNLPDWTRTPHQKPSYSSKCRYPLVLVLDGVADPGNVGTLIRSAVACGASALYLLPDCCDPWNAKALRSAMGTTFSIPIYTMDSWRDCREELIQRHCCTVSTIFAATMWRQEEQDHDSAPLLRNDSSLGTGASTVSSHSSVSHYDVDWCPDRHLDVVADEEDNDDDSAAVLSTSSSTGRRGSALVIGNEGHGLSSSLRQSLLDREISAVHIPMQPGSVESLNAAVCGSVILFEYYRQTQQQSLDTSLSSSSQSKQP